LGPIDSCVQVMCDGPRLLLRIILDGCTWQRFTGMYWSPYIIKLKTWPAGEQMKYWTLSPSPSPWLVQCTPHRWPGWRPHSSHHRHWGPQAFSLSAIGKREEGNVILHFDYLYTWYKNIPLHTQLYLKKKSHDWLQTVNYRNKGNANLPSEEL